MTDCIFCKIIAGEIAADKIFEDDKVLAFMDIRPVSRGHLLVIPKKHTDDILQTDDATAADLIHKAKKIADAAVKAVNADGFTISTNKGEAAGQTVFHLHFHVIPRYTGDGLNPWQHQELEPKTRKEIAEAIKKNL
jgi:histidine triad (HIT) family protein